MTLPFSYELLQPLHTGTSTYVIRAKASDNKTYIIKENSRAVTSRKKLRKFFQEYMIGSSIKSKYVVKYMDMKRFGYRFAVVMEDIGGKAIKEFILSNGSSVDLFIQIAIRIANKTNNVVDLMVTKLRRTPEVQRVLGIAARIGTQFELKLFASLCGFTQILALL